ncbi:MAG TPA: DNA topoisomerase IV subunit A [Thermoanaerobaculia bacterium]|nr:DNA topoisomerase IV subunit A [Thermoanaerobaculia bacterium]
MPSIEPLMRRNFLEYASYVIVDRAIPDLRDGMKPVQRRILATLHAMDDGRFHKVANVIGETMKLHPHGDASISDALVVLANKEYFIEKQGNFGNLMTGHPAAAARYIECRLTDLARETLFHRKLTETRPSYDGRRMEPVVLPVKVPVVLMIGTEGIAVGMSTRILPHNFRELLRAQIAILRGGKATLHPDFLQGGLMDASDYQDGVGRVRVRAKLEIARDRKTITVREIPYSTTTESLIQSIEAAAQKGKLKVASIEDRTGEQVEIVLNLARGSYADEVEPQLYAYTQCEVSIVPSPIVIDHDRPVEMPVSQMLERLTKRLREQIKAELELDLSELEDRRHFLTLEQIFIERRVYQRIEKAKTVEAVRKAVWDGMHEYQKLFVRPMIEDDVERLLEIRIRRISAYDVERNRREIAEVQAAIKECRRKLRRLTDSTVAYLEGLLAKYGDRWPRRTKVGSFETVSKREIALQNLRLAYDPDSGFFGMAVRGTKFQLQVSEFDKILVVDAAGTYRITVPQEKLFVGKGAHVIERFDEEKGAVLTVLYRDEERHAWAKKVQIRGYIRDKEYRLVKEGGRVDRVIVGESDRIVHLRYAPHKFQRLKEDFFDLRELELSGLSARGKRMGSKPVAGISLEQPS